MNTEEVSELRLLRIEKNGDFVIESPLISTRASLNFRYIADKGHIVARLDAGQKLLIDEQLRILDERGVVLAELKQMKPSVRKDGAFAIRKYCFTDETRIVNGRELKRIKALRNVGGCWRFDDHGKEYFSFADCTAKEGELGGFIESEKNLSQTDDSWIGVDAVVYENATISTGAKIRGHAEISGYATIEEYAVVTDAKICGVSLIGDEAHVSGEITLCDVQLTGHCGLFPRTKNPKLIPVVVVR